MDTFGPLPVTRLAVRAYRALEWPPRPSWVEWAVQELVMGNDGPNLRILAGLSEPFDYFETVTVVDKTLAELGMSQVAREEAVRSYVAELLLPVAESKKVSTPLLEALAELCIALGYPADLMPFYLLHFAGMDLSTGGYQHYWDGANEENIDEIVCSQAEVWLAER